MRVSIPARIAGEGRKLLCQVERLGSSGISRGGRVFPVLATMG